MPTITAGTRGAGLAVLVGSAAFALPLAVWLRYSRAVAGGGGLYGFVVAAGLPRLALVQALVWTVSYSLYLIYTTVAIVYDTLPVVIGPYRGWLAVGIPAVLVAIMLAGRNGTIAVLGAGAGAQLLFLAILAVALARHGGTPHASTLAGPTLAGRVGGFGTAAGQLSLLYVCGSLPLFLGGELRRPQFQLRRALLVGYTATAVATVLLAPSSVLPERSRCAGRGAVNPARPDRNAPVWATALLVLLGVVIIAAGIIYFADPAGKLPSFFPGHQAGSAHHHTKHGIAALVVGLLALAVAWLSSGTKRAAA